MYLQFTNIIDKPPEPVYKLMPATSPKFVGYENYLQILSDYFGLPSKKSSRRTFVLFGVGGVGKTQICLKFIDDNTDRQVRSQTSEITLTCLLAGSGKSFGLMPPTRRLWKPVFNQLLVILMPNLRELNSPQKQLSYGFPDSSMSGCLCLMVLIMNLTWSASFYHQEVGEMS